MKKTALALILFLMLFVLIFGVQVVKVVKAVDILYPTNSTYNSGSPLGLSVRSGGLGANNIYYSMTYSVDGKDNFSIPLITQTHNMSFQITVTGSGIIPKLPEGSHNVTVYEEIQWDTTPPHTFLDNATAYFTIDDGKPPIITNLSPENKTYSQNNLSLNFTIDEPTSWIGYSLDGQDNVTVAGNTTLANLSFQEHNVTVYAQDLAGNIGPSETINFTISQPAPFPTSTVAMSSGALTSVVVAGLLVYFKKHKR